jgi:hypothetical protein
LNPPPILAANLHAVSGIEYNSHLRSFGNTTEIDDSFSHLLRGRVLYLGHLEIQPL